MNATIMARLGCDTSGFSKPLREAGNIAEQEHRRMAHSARRNTDAHEDLWKSGNRVTKQAQGFTREMLNARSATDVLSVGLDRLENSLNLSLGKGMALAIGAVLIDQIGKAVTKARTLREEVAKIGRESGGNTQFQSLNELEQRLTRIQSKVEEIKKRGLLDIGKEAVAKYGLGFVGMALNKDLDPFGDQGLSKLEKARRSTLSGIADKARQQNEVESIRLTDGDLAAQKAALYIKRNEDGAAARASGNEALDHEIGRRLYLALENLEKSIRTVQMDRGKMSLAELAAEGGQYEFHNSGMSQAQMEQRIRDREAARNVMAWEAEGDRLRGAGNQAGALQAFSKADEIRSSISGLKESEKDLKGAINASELPALLREIAKNTAQPLVNR